MESKCPDEFAHVQDDVKPHILRMLEGTFSFNTAHIRSDIEENGYADRAM